MTSCIISFNVFGEPTGAARPRFSNGHAYMPEKTRKYEAQVAKAFAEEQEFCESKAAAVTSAGTDKDGFMDIPEGLQEELPFA